MKKYYRLFKEGSKVNQIICAVLINLPVFAYGASIGWMSPMTLLLQSKDSPRGEPLKDIEVSWMAAVAYLTCIPGNFLMAFLGDTFGRKLTLLFISSTGAASWILMLSSFDVWALILARALVGITMSGCYVTCPIYTKEISDDSIRGALGCLHHFLLYEFYTFWLLFSCWYQHEIGSDFFLSHYPLNYQKVILFHTSGNLFLYIIGDLLSYRTVLWICLSLPTFHLVLFMMMPDSPSYLVKRSNVEEAARVLAWLRCKSEEDQSVKNELEVIKKEQISDMESNRFLLRTIIKDNILSKAFYIALTVTLAREICGAIPILNFAGDIFAIASTGTSLVLSPNQQAMLLGVVQVTGSMLASSIVEKAGRKPILSITSLISGLSMCALASWFVAKDYGAATPNWIPIVTLCLCIFCDACGLQPISIVIAGEIFSYKYRGTVMAITMSVASFFDFLQLLFFKPLANSIGIHAAFYFFGVVCIFMALYVVIVIPETKGKSLVEIYKCLRPKKTKQEELVDGNLECNGASK